MAAIVDDIYYGCKTKYVERCVKHGIKIIYSTYYTKYFHALLLIAQTYLVHNRMDIRVYKQ